MVCVEYIGDKLIWCSGKQRPRCEILTQGFFVFLSVIYRREGKGLPVLVYDLKGQGLREGQCGGLVEIGGKASGRLSSERMGWLMFRVTVLKGDGQEKSKRKKKIGYRENTGNVDRRS